MNKFLKIKTYLFCVLFSVCLAIFPAAVIASTLYLMPQSQDVSIGDTFIVEARIDTDKKEINTIDGMILFSRDKLQAIDVNNGGSAISLWLKEPIYSNEKGEVSFSGGTPNGFIGQGAVLKITFKVINSGADKNPAKVYFKENSNILLNDGKGTADKISLIDGNYKIIEKELNLPVITSSSWPDQEKWYKGDEVKLHWDLVKDAEYSYIFSKDVLAEPDNIPDKPEGSLQWMGDMTLKGFTDDGIYYFSLKQKLPGKDWSGKVSFKMMIDNFPPEDFVPRITEIEGKKYLVFVAQDTTSGMDRFEVSESETQSLSAHWWRLISRFTRKDENWKVAKSPYLLEDQSLEKNIKIKAIDKAGNERLAEIVPPKKVIPYKKIGLVFIIVIMIILILAWVKYIKCKNKKTCD